MTVEGRKLFYSPFRETSPLRGLILDCSESTRFVARFFLNSLQVATEEASSGKEGLRRLIEDRFDFVLLDHALLDMSCEEFLECFEQAGFETPPRIILVTATPAEMPEASKVAVVLEKPFTVGRLEDTISTLFPV